MRREACRALKGSMLRQEVYAVMGGTEGSCGTPTRSPSRTSPSECLQPRGPNRPRGLVRRSSRNPHLPL